MLSADCTIADHAERIFLFLSPSSSSTYVIPAEVQPQKPCDTTNSHVRCCCLEVSVIVFLFASNIQPRPRRASRGQWISQFVYRRIMPVNSPPPPRGSCVPVRPRVTLRTWSQQQGRTRRRSSCVNLSCSLTA